MATSTLALPSFTFLLFMLPVNIPVSPVISGPFFFPYSHTENLNLMLFFSTVAVNLEPEPEPLLYQEYGPSITSPPILSVPETMITLVLLVQPPDELVMPPEMMVKGKGQDK